MNIFESIILGLIQGLTEFIPISSSGHLVIAQTFISGAGDHLFLEWINIGTVFALIIFFRQRIIEAVKAIFISRDYRLLTNVLVAVLPAASVGFTLASFIENEPFFTSLWTVVVMLLAVGIVLVILERLPRLSEVKMLEKLPKKRALLVGLAQMVALIPGTSRSGSTIIAGRLSGLSQAKAAEFSFLISIPIMLGVILKLVSREADRAYFLDNWVSLSIGNIAAFISGLIAVGFLMRFLEKRSLAIFGWYRIGLALFIIGLILLKWVQV